MVIWWCRFQSAVVFRLFPFQYIHRVLKHVCHFFFNYSNGCWCPQVLVCHKGRICHMATSLVSSLTMPPPKLRILRQIAYCSSNERCYFKPSFILTLPVYITSYSLKLSLDIYSSKTALVQPLSVSDM